MNIAEVKAAVHAGKSVHWANGGYRVHRDGLGQYLITYVRNGSTIGLTDRSGRQLNESEADFFISEPRQDVAAEQGGWFAGRRRTPRPAPGRADGQERKERGLCGFAIP